MRLLSGLFLATALFAAPAAFADPKGPPPPGGPREACKADVQTLCASVAGGEDRRAIGKCLRDNKDKLSDGCKAAMSEMREQRGDRGGKGRGQRGAGSCRADAEKLCAGVQPGEGRILKCLKDNEAKVSDACKADMAEMQKRQP